MQTRTDQIHSYEFFLQRVISGLVSRESDPAELPFRRLGWSGFGSVMVTIIVAGIVAIVGLLVGGGNDAWRDGDSIIQERGTDTFYVYEAGRLHPMTNLVSAQLYMGGADVVRVSARSLAGVPRGATLGIVGAPNLPRDSDDLLTGAWTVCSQQPTTDDDPEPISVLGVGRGPSAGLAIGGDGLLVRATEPDASHHLVWQGYRYEIDPAVLREVIGALTVSLIDVLPVPPAWLHALPEGERLTLPPGYVETGATVVIDDEELRVGQVIEDGAQRYLVLADGRVAELTVLQAAIVERLPDQADPVALQLSTGVSRVALPDRTPSSPPRAVPEVVTSDVHRGSACAVFGAGEFIPAVQVAGSLDPNNATPNASPEGTALADFVAVEGGKAALVLALPAPGAQGGQWHIVNDQGIQFPLSGADVAGSLGYESGRSVEVPSGLVDLLARGPSLAPAAARSVPDPGAGGGQPAG